MLDSGKINELSIAGCDSVQNHHYIINTITKLFLLCLFILISSISYSQSVPAKLIKLSELQSMKKQATKAFQEYPIKQLQSEIKKIDKEVNKISIDPEIVALKSDINAKIRYYNVSKSFLTDNDVINYLSFLKYDEYLMFIEQNIDSLYIDLTNAYISKMNFDSARIFVYKYLDNGGSNIEFINSIVTNPDVSMGYEHDIFNTCLYNRIISYKKNNVCTNLILDFIFINDQLTRWFNYNSRYSLAFPIENVYKSDTINQLIIEQILQTKTIMDTSTLILSKEFGSVLLHSIYSNTPFFEKHFHLLSNKLNNRFDSYAYLRYIFDMYLLKTRDSQCFGTVKKYKTFDIKIENPDTVEKIKKQLKIDISDYNFN